MPGIPIVIDGERQGKRSGRADIVVSCFIINRMRPKSISRALILGIFSSISILASGAQCSSGFAGKIPENGSFPNKRTWVVTAKTAPQGEESCAGREASGREQDRGADPSTSSKGSSGATVSLKRLFLNLPGDQRAIWSAPFHLKTSDASWLAPFAGSTALLIASDRRNMAREHSNSVAIQRSQDVANGGLFALAGVPAVMWAWGGVTGQPRLHETGLLTGEALVNSLAVDEALKLVFQRERPAASGGQGNFFSQLSNPGFPSTHATLSWTAASVIAHEYPGIIPQTLAYGTAAAVSLARVTGRKHFPSDVVVGSALGWMIGRKVFQTHHNTDLDDMAFGNFASGDGELPGGATGTTFVPIDSWVYPVFDRLAAMGYIDTATAGLRPWSRAECSRLVQEAGLSLDTGGPGNGLTSTLYKQLAAEFPPEVKEGRRTSDSLIEEVYTRVGIVSGQPLADDYHFAKTITDDYGRPFGKGADAVIGASARSVVGPVAFYVRGEYQHAGTLPTQSPTLLQSIASADAVPFFPQQRTGTLDRFRALDAYVAFNYHNNLISFGKQTLWWGAGADAPFLFSNNAEPLPLLRISRATPFVLPSVFRLIGKIRLELLWGQLNGHQFIGFADAAGARETQGPPIQPHPFIQGEKISFKPTRNLEFGFGVTAILGGPHAPLTLHSLLRSYSLSNGVPGSLDPGDRRSAFDFSYRLPGLRDWATLYADSFTEDEFSPIAYPRKSAVRAGLYLPRLPRLEQVDLRAEGIYTDLPNLQGTGVAYYNTHYFSGWTNYGQIIGNTIGREGRGLNIWSTYHFSARNSLQLHYRNQHVNPAFLQGGYLRDFDATGTLVRAGNLVFSGRLKYEHWNFPLLSAVPKTNVSAALQVSYSPAHGWSIFGRNTGDK